MEHPVRDRRHISVPAALLLTGVAAAALVFGISVNSGQPNYFAATMQVLIGTDHAEATAGEIGKILDGSAANTSDAALLSKELEQIYGARDHRAIWTGSPMATGQAGGAIQALRASWEHGLDPADYHVQELATLDPKTIAEAADYDVLLSDGVLRYARDMRLGRAAARSVDKDVLVPVASDIVVALSEAIEAGAVGKFLDDFVPAFPDYAKLKDALARYGERAASGGFPNIPATTRIVQATNSRPMLRLRERLAMEDTELSAAPRGANNNDVVAALKRYQARNGLAASGQLTRETLRMLNVPAAQRASQIAANMERWRWLPKQIEPTRIMVNVPVGMLTAYRDGSAVITSRAVVGAPSTPTPILATTAKSILVNPPWNVPVSIVRGEILPKLQSDPYYLESMRMRVVGKPSAAAWRTGNGLHIQQQPGPGSALGVLKFEMPNHFDVYLHDTPAKAAFNRDMRAISHGCVRVHQILPLGSFALTGDPKSGLARISSTVSERRTQSLALPNAMPVYILYQTAVPEESGAIGFKPDVYGRDRRLIDAVADIRRLPENPGTKPN